MSRTTDQWEALLEGATPGPWKATIQSFAENEGGAYSLHAEISDKDDMPLMYAEDAFVFHKEPNFTCAAAAPEAVAEVIRLRRELEEISIGLERKAERAQRNGAYSAAVGYRETAKKITRILNQE